jgi:peptidoglycan/xylan/chitin deacetylase (PgdA/CDA1 family)
MARVVPQLIVPYTLDCNDMRFALPQGYSHADPFFQYMRDTFDALYAEGDPAGLDRPKMMSIGMHCRLLGRPGRITALQRFLDHIQRHDRCGWRGASTSRATGSTTILPRNLNKICLQRLRIKRNKLSF